MKISFIITSYKEPKTIGRAIEAVISQRVSNLDVIVVAPDDETLAVAKGYGVKTVKDYGKGKPAALNLVVKKAKGNILIFSDGDVYIGKNSIREILKPFKDSKVGAVSGNVVSLNSKKNMLGYWAYLLTKVTHELRLEKLNSTNRFFCTGYLFAIRKELFPKLPENLLSEDGYISNNVYEKGYAIKYTPKAKVYVKYPTTFKDWIIQKRRSAGGYNQIKQITGKKTVRSFKSESLGVFRLFKYITSFKEFFWFIALIFARLYLWFVIYIDINVKKKSQKEIWKRVETTK